MCILHKTGERLCEPRSVFNPHTHNLYIVRHSVFKPHTHNLYIVRHSVFKPHTHNLYIVRHYTNIVYSKKMLYFIS
jgi:hypothetical protein